MTAQGSGFASLHAQAKQAYSKPLTTRLQESSRSCTVPRSGPSGGTRSALRYPGSSRVKRRLCSRAGRRRRHHMGASTKWRRQPTRSKAASSPSLKIKCKSYMSSSQGAACRPCDKEPFHGRFGEVVEADVKMDRHTGCKRNDLFLFN